MKKKKLPKFKSKKEEARFWDSHSALDYPDEVNDVEAGFEFAPELVQKAVNKKKERKRLLTLRIEQEQVDLAKAIAQCKGLGYQTQMRMWIIQGIHKEMREHPEIKKYIQDSAA